MQRICSHKNRKNETGRGEKPSDEQEKKRLADETNEQQHYSNVKQWRRRNRKRMDGTSSVQLFGAMLFLPNKMERKTNILATKWKQQCQMVIEKESISMVWQRMHCRLLNVMWMIVCVCVCAQAKDSGDHI